MSDFEVLDIWYIIYYQYDIADIYGIVNTICPDILDFDTINDGLLLIFSEILNLDSSSPTVLTNYICKPSA